MKFVFRKIVKSLQLVLLLGVLFVFAMFQGGFVSWFLFYSMLPIVIYMIIIPFYPVHNWKVARQLSARYTETGGMVDVTITIKRSFRFPIFFLVIEDPLPDSLAFQDPGKKKYRDLSNPALLHRKRMGKQVVYPGFKKNVVITYTLDHLPRGMHRLQTIMLKIGDPFGFVEADHRFDVIDELIVYPAVQDMKWRHTSMSLEEGAASSTVHDDKITNIVSGVREYIPGDRFSWIDWKTTARKNTVMTKEFEQEKDSNIAVVLDIGGFSDQQPLRFEAAIEWTASVLEALRKKGQNISFYTFGKQERFFSHQQLQFEFPAIQHYLTTVEQEKEISLAEQISAPLSEIAKGSIVLFVIHELDELLIERFAHWRNQDYRIFVCYIISEKDLRTTETKYVQLLRAKQIAVQVVSEQQLRQDHWEVHPSR
ncbi:DUF58 domain-containing protein [Gracilibacillus caseinilyticus]|uniref:DUF58 domain-containing protein n=1 Tax=Gracilibacillus caseinilyticus TaxID=2932256 RepID=A0ABY4EXM6_9BACI|nr:DUF58 domain-containing protein [Gracilibacillus caseinilyticus]UOQ49035.1 DUF58 domain-containing protein [Gracilibacillus caseinilyticus]